MGLLDMYRYTGNKEAFEVAEKFADWFYDFTDGKTREEMDDILDFETGGMLEIWADFYEFTKDGYIKRTSKRSYQASKDDETILKDNDYILGLYELNTLDTLLLFTNLGNYLYLPVYEIPDLKWKEIGKHISNIIKINPEENIIGSILKNKNNPLKKRGHFSK